MQANSTGPKKVAHGEGRSSEAHRVTSRSVPSRPWCVGNGGPGSWRANLGRSAGPRCVVSGKSLISELFPPLYDGGKYIHPHPPDPCPRQKFSGVVCVWKNLVWGAWLAQSVEGPTLDFSSGHDLMVHEFKPHIRLCADSVEPAWDSLFPSLPLPLPRPYALSKINKLKALKKKKESCLLGSITQCKILFLLTENEAELCHWNNAKHRNNLVYSLPLPIPFQFHYHLCFGFHVGRKISRFGGVFWSQERILFFFFFFFLNVWSTSHWDQWDSDSYFEFTLFREICFKIPN